MALYVVCFGDGSSEADMHAEVIRGEVAHDHVVLLHAILPVPENPSLLF